MFQEHGDGASENVFKRDVESEQKQIRRQVGTMPDPVRSMNGGDRPLRPAYRQALLMATSARALSRPPAE